jgi:glycine/D-amino acid oxidase-like deaminating enzyme
MEFEASAASAERFTKELAVRCVRDKHLDVTFLYNTQVKAIKISNASDGNSKPWISMLQTNQGVVPLSQGSHVVVAAGAWTPHVLSLLELYAPVYPLKGYAMSVSAQEALRLLKLTDKELPSRIVCDQYMFTSRLGDEIRVTSIGEFSGWATLPTPSVLPAFRYEAIRQFPQLQPLMECAPVKCGHRPYVSDGILLLGRMDTHQNLYVSCGPGSNGKVRFSTTANVSLLIRSLTRLCRRIRMEASCWIGECHYEIGVRSERKRNF